MDNILKTPEKPRWQLIRYNNEQTPWVLSNAGIYSNSLEIHDLEEIFARYRKSYELEAENENLKNEVKRLNSLNNENGEIASFWRKKWSKTLSLLIKANDYIKLNASFLFHKECSLECCDLCDHNKILAEIENGLK